MRAPKLLCIQSRQNRIEGIVYHLTEGRATMVDIVENRLWYKGLAVGALVCG